MHKSRESLDKQQESQIGKHLEVIKCPECGTIQQAEVEHTIPWYTYIHHCIKCGFIITESDWNRPDEK